MKTKAGWVLTLLVGGLLLFSASGKFGSGEEMAQGFQHLGLDLEVAKTLGIMEALIALIYLVPRTSFVGAILVTGYMGGAILAHFRVHDPVLVQAIVPIVAWIGLGLRRYPEILSLLGMRKPLP